MRRALLLFVGLTLVSVSSAQLFERQRKPGDVAEIALFPMAMQQAGSPEAKDTLALLARGLILAECKTRAIGSISPILLETSEREMELKLSDPMNWTGSNISTVSRRWTADIVVAVMIRDLRSEAVPATATTPAALSTTASLTIWIWEKKTQKFLVEELESNYVRTTVKPKEGEKALMMEQANAIADGVLKAMKPALDPFKKKKS